MGPKKQKIRVNDEKLREMESTALAAGTHPYICKVSDNKHLSSSQVPAYCSDNNLFILS